MRLENTFERLRNCGEKALITFITAGDPDIDTTEKLVLEMEKKGADIIELGMPFSDPLADGPIIQKSSQRALERGMNTSLFFEMVSRLRRKTQVPLVVLTYYNPVFSYGEEKFIRDAARAGIDGLVIPDLPLEESRLMQSVTLQQGVDLIYLLTPTSTEERIRLTAERAQGFIYCVALTGVTGVRENISLKAEEMVNRIRKFTSLPLALGFGISTPQQAESAAAFCDGVIVGSGIVRMVEQLGESPEDLLKEVGNFVSSLKEGTRGQFPRSVRKGG